MHTDETNESANTNIEDEILGGTDWAKVDRSTPLLPEAIYDLVIKDVTKTTNEKTGRSSLKIVLATTQDERAVGTGDVLHKGFPIFHNIGLTPTENYPRSAIEKSIAKFLDAAGIDSIVPLEQWKGAGIIVQVKLKIEKADGDFPESNKVKQFIPLKNT